MTINKSRTQHIDNGVHPVCVTSQGPVSREWRPLHIVYTNDDDFHNMFFFITTTNNLKQSGVSLHDTFFLQELVGEIMCYNSNIKLSIWGL